MTDFLKEVGTTEVAELSSTMTNCFQMIQCMKAMIHELILIILLT